MYKKMLVPLDGSELSEASLTHVIALTKSCQVPEVILIRVREPLDAGVRQRLSGDLAKQLDEAYNDETKEYLSKISNYLADKGIKAETVAVAGSAAESILSYSKENSIDLIVMSSHGRTGIARWAFGSVAEKVLRQSVVPVLIIPHKTS